MNGGIEMLGKAAAVAVMVLVAGCGRQEPAAASKQAATSAPAAAVESKPDLQVTLQEDEFIPTLGIAEGAHVKRVSILNRSEKPIKIIAVSLNGEQETGVLALKGEPKHAEHPVVLTVGDSALFSISAQSFAQGFEGKLVGYTKAVVFVDITTDLGTHRYSFK